MAFAVFKAQLPSALAVSGQEFSIHGHELLYGLHSAKLTWNLKQGPLNGRVVYKASFFRFRVNDEV